MKVQERFEAEYAAIMALPPEEVVEKGREKRDRVNRRTTRGEYEVLAIGAGLGARLMKKPKDVKRLTAARNFTTRGTPDPFRLAMELILEATDTNGRSRADQWAKAGQRLIIDLGVPPEKIPEELKNLGGIAEVAKQARSANGRSPKGASNEADGMQIETRSTVARSGVIKSIKGSDEVEIVVRLSKRAAKAVAELKDHWAADVNLERVPGQAAFFGRSAKVESEQGSGWGVQTWAILEAERQKRAKVWTRSGTLVTRTTSVRATRKAR
ncbi:MAG: hypothetical protein H2042_01685 [Rhizobiales bacterium]|nr:hypothetical protein [Hyphomicrobiales bacterium]